MKKEKNKTICTVYTTILLKDKGITLIALVITILVLLILAGIAVSMIVGNNGIMNKTVVAVEENRNSSAEEEIALAWVSCETDYNIGIAENYTAKRADYYTIENLNKYLVGKGTVSEVKYRENGTSKVTYTSSTDANITDQIFKVDKSGNVSISDGSNLEGEEKTILAENNMTELTEENYPANMQNNNNIKAVISGDGGNVPIPVNCTYIDGSNNEGSDSYGVVIKDTKDNEWVWIPVPNARVLYETNANGISLSGGTGVKTYKYSKGNIISGETRTTPGGTSNREPDLAKDYDKDANASTLLTDAGFETKTAKYMAETIVAEYENMIKSITQYGGFYVGRYELSGTVESPKIQKEEDPLTNVNWYKLYKADRILGDGIGGVTTGMIWGCQWDVMCNWIANTGDKKNINDSTSWGNHMNAEVVDNYGNVIKPSYDSSSYSESRVKLKTGITNYTKANNLYDVAGNCWEWTMETINYYGTLRCGRGSDYQEYGSTLPPSTGRCNAYPQDGYEEGTSPPVLLINPVP